MNYLEFYRNAKRNIKETLLSMWASGQGTHQHYLSQLLDEETLLSEPVFQATFPWKPASRTFEELDDIFDKNFIDSLDQIDNPDFRFPNDRAPYLHQEKSWDELLNKKKSIVVTSGTGSGKTECFMLPVVQDLLQQRQAGHSAGVQAIFLYPLNALMNSQRNRIKAWCEAVDPQIPFAIYNGNTPEDGIPSTEQQRAYPELLSRRTIRNTPPQILFTNPTMLEYMLVRKKDQPILHQSKGKLRWILLDETHTYSGSSAAELSMQIRRIMDAFEVNVNQVRFASTSATIGTESEEQLKQFIARLTGKEQDDITVINGEQVIPQLLDNANTDPRIIELRDEIVSRKVLSATEIGTKFKPDASIEESLEIIDELGEKQDDLIAAGIKDALLPTRAHYFIRSIGGVFVCTNPNCTRHQNIRPSIGSMTTYIRSECECGAPLVELAACNSCGNHLLIAEKENSEYPASFRLPVPSEEELFELYETDEDETQENLEPAADWSPIVLSETVNVPPSNSANLIACSINIEDATIVQGGNFRECIHNNGTSLCPHCGNRTDHLKHLRTSTAFLSRILSSALLEQADPMTGNIAGRLWHGRKYISFTDNRQGTAKSALAQNTEVERNWIRTAVFHYLSDIKRNAQNDARELTEEEQQEYNFLIVGREQGIPGIEARLQELENIIQGIHILPNPRISFNELFAHLSNDANFIDLFRHISTNPARRNHYLKALLIDQFGRRPRKGNAPETMGLVKLIFPRLEDSPLPNTFEQLGWNINDWKDFLKICVDFFLRENTHIILPFESRPFITQRYASSNVYESACDLRHPVTNNRVKRWPLLEKTNGSIRESQNRLILLLCAAMGITDHTTISDENIDRINSILSRSWETLIPRLLTDTDTRNENFTGYKLDFFAEGKVSIELLEKAWFCPVTFVPMDTIFRGYSPAIKGNINSDNFMRYRVTEELEYPYFPYANKKKKVNDGQLVRVQNEEILEWKDNNLTQQIELGLWSNLLERVFLNNPIYLAAEHSAQQSKGKLAKIEEDFNDGKINILSCSTTMEMGVDIGGISEVIMNNVPPKAANYLQRAGRAGRRKESKAMAVTFCAPNPIGMAALNDPKWAMTHETAMPIVKLESSKLIQRHINSFLFAAYIAIIEGANVKANVGDFFYDNEANEDPFNYQHFGVFLNELLIADDAEMKRRYCRMVNSTILETQTFEQAIEACLTILGDNYDQLVLRVTMLNQAEAELLATPGIDENSIEVKAIRYQRGQLLRQKLLGYLAENDFIPSAGIPTGIVEFNKTVVDDENEEDDTTENTFFRSNPSLSITRALTEYSPGKQVILNEKCYESAGIVLKSEWSESRRAILQSCPICGFNRLGIGINIQCPICANPRMHGVQSIGGAFTEVIEPAGFSVDYLGETNRTISHKPGPQNTVDPILLNMTPWEIGEDISQSKYEIRVSNDDSEILYYNKGNGSGYSICIKCGRAMQEHGNATDGPSPLARHNRLHTSQTCTGNNNHGSSIKRNVILGGRLQTDFVEIRFRNSDDELIRDEDSIWSLGVILSRKLAEHLGINSQEINFGVKRYPAYSSIFIFDTAKGGAGYSVLFMDYAQEIFDMALHALYCDCQKACTSCLIDRDSQWHIAHLDRNNALEWLMLEQASRTEIPDNVSAQFQGARKVTSDLRSEITRTLSKPDISKVIFFISNETDKWNPDSWQYSALANRLKLQGKTVEFATKLPDTSNLSARELSAAINVTSKNQVNIQSEDLPEDFQAIMLAEFYNNDPQLYFTESISKEFSENWGITENPVYKASVLYDFNFIEWNIDLLNLVNDDKLLFEYKVIGNTTLYSLFNKLMSNESENWEKITTKIRNSQVRVSYMEHYLRDALGCLMVLNLLKSFSNDLNIEIESLDFELSRFSGNALRGENHCIDDDFPDSTERSQFLTEASAALLNIEPTFTETRHLPHWREMVISSDDFDLIIRPNGGIKNGWALDYTEGRVRIDEIHYEDNFRLHNQTLESGILYNIVFEIKK